jgi:hypothetical protein
MTSTDIKNINVIEVVAATLAAVSAAVAASFLGVAGTVAGAVLGGVVGTVGTAVYANSLTRGRRRWTALRPRLTANGRRRWPLAVASTAAAVILAIGAITIAELALGHPLANLFGAHVPGRTSIGNVPGRPATTTPGTPAPTLVSPTGSASAVPSTTTSTEPASPAPSAGTGSASATPAPTPTATNS